jgi:hypothetical protein
MPNIQPNVLALVICVVAGFFLSFAWYTPIFGKIWHREMGFDAAEKPTTPAFIKSLLLTVVSVFLIAFVLSSQIAVWTPSTWGSSIPALPKHEQALQAAFFTWLGFFVPKLLTGVAWDKRSWTLFAIDAGYYFVLLLICSSVLLYM